MDENTSALETESPPPITEEEDVKPLSTGEEASIEARKLPQYVAALSVAIGAFALGTTLGWSSAANVKLKEEDTIHLTDEQLSWIGSLMGLGAAFATFPTGYSIEVIGRKTTMLILVAPFTVGWLLLAFPRNVAMLYAGRFITGMCGGAFSIAVPIYIGEISEKEIRGELSSFFQLMLTVGILYTYVIGPYVPIAAFGILCGIVPVVFGVTFFFMPESPLYYLKKNDRELAEKSLKLLRGPNFDVEPELHDMEEYVQQLRDQNMEFNMLFTKAAVRATTIAFGLMFFLQMEGSNAVIFYTQDIFKAANVDLDPAVSTIIVGVMLVLATMVATFIVDRAGRRILLLISYTIMGICALLLGIYFNVKDKDSGKDLGWLPMFSMTVYLIGFSLGNGPVPWIMLGEVFPAEIKGLGSSSSCMFDWLLAFVVTRYYDAMANSVGTDVTFWIFATTCFLGDIFVFTLVIETKGKSLEDIQQELSGKIELNKLRTTVRWK